MLLRLGVYSLSIIIDVERPINIARSAMFIGLSTSIESSLHCVQGLNNSLLCVLCDLCGRKFKTTL